MVQVGVLQARTEQAQALFRNPDSTQFVIVTIPTVMAVAESSRLAKALKKESVLVKSLVMNQVNEVLDHKRRTGTMSAIVVCILGIFSACGTQEYVGESHLRTLAMLALCLHVLIYHMKKSNSPLYAFLLEYSFRT
jgi:anion-transporting  ArsA/GET3 family ATPase